MSGMIGMATDTGIDNKAKIMFM